MCRRRGGGWWRREFGGAVAIEEHAVLSKVANEGTEIVCHILIG
jgi:hypothetical protein